MKRTPIKRGGSSLKRTALKKGTSTLSRDKGLKSNVSLKPSGNSLKRSQIKAKPKVVSAEEKSCREIVKRRSQGMCEICGYQQATDMAHRVGAGQSGKWVPSNILHACRKCHSFNHENPENSFNHGWHLRMNSNSLEEPVLLHINGTKKWVKLDDLGHKFLVDFKV